MEKEHFERTDEIIKQFNSIRKRLTDFIEQHKGYAFVITTDSSDRDKPLISADNLDIYVVVDMGKL